MRPGDVDEIASRPVDDLVDVLVVDFERAAAAVPRVHGEPPSGAGGSEANARRGDVRLIVIRLEHGATSDLDELVGQEQPAGDRAHVAHARVVS